MTEKKYTKKNLTQLPQDNQELRDSEILFKNDERELRLKKQDEDFKLDVLD